MSRHLFGGIDERTQVTILVNAVNGIVPDRPITQTCPMIHRDSLQNQGLVMTFIDLLELKIENFKAANGLRPAKIKLGRTQVRALKDFMAQYLSHPDRSAGGRVSPNYEGIPIEETNEEDQFELE